MPYGPQFQYARPRPYRPFDPASLDPLTPRGLQYDDDPQAPPPMMQAPDAGMDTPDREQLPDFLGRQLPGGSRPPVTAPQVKQGPERQRYEDMLKAGPRRSVAGSIAGGALGAAAGYLNAGGKVRVDQPDTHGMVWRAPKGTNGSWDTAVTRQHGLAGLEHTREQEQTARDKEASRMDLENRQQADREAHTAGSNRYYDEQAETNRRREADTAANEALKRMKDQAGPGATVIPLAPGDPPPSGPGWTVRPSPDPREPKGSRYAIRRGVPVDEATGVMMGLSPDANGQYMADSQKAITDAYKNQVKRMGDADALAAKEAGAREHKREFDARMANTEANTQLTRAQHAGLAEEKKNARNVALQAKKDREIADAQADYIQASEKLGATATELVSEKQLMRSRKQMALDAYQAAVPGGEKWVVDQEGQITKASGSPPPVVTAPPTGGRGGRGAPPPGPRAEKVFPANRVAEFATANSMDDQQARAVLASQGYTIR